MPKFIPASFGFDLLAHTGLPHHRTTALPSANAALPCSQVYPAITPTPGASVEGMVSGGYDGLVGPSTVLHAAFHASSAPSILVLLFSPLDTGNNCLLGPISHHMLCSRHAQAHAPPHCCSPLHRPGVLRGPSAPFCCSLLCTQVLTDLTQQEGATLDNYEAHEYFRQTVEPTLQASAVCFDHTGLLLTPSDSWVSKLLKFIPLACVVSYEHIFRPLNALPPTQHQLY